MGAAPRRIGQGLVGLAILFVLVFCLLRAIPGDPAQLMAGPTASPEQVDRIRHDLGLDQSIPAQLIHYLGGAVEGNLGRSTLTDRPVLAEIAARLPFTLALAGAAMLIAVVAGVPAGMLAARRKDSTLDAAIIVVAVTLTSLPGFWFALVMIDVFSVRLRLLPSSGANSALAILLPAVVLAATQIGMIVQLTRGTMIEVLQQDYIRTARAKGLPGRAVLWRHALRNALVPTVTVIGLQAGLLIGGAVVTESVFNWPGVGRFLVQAVLYRDYPVIQALVLLFGICVLLVNLGVDLATMRIDPRLREQVR